MSSGSLGNYYHGMAELRQEYRAYCSFLFYKLFGGSEYS